MSQGPEHSPSDSPQNLTGAPNADSPGAAAAPPSDTGETPTGMPAAAGSPQSELEAAQAKASEHFDQYMRAVAETENVRRRAQEDVSKAHKFAIESFAESMLPVRDSLEMALKVDTPTVDSLKEGVEATLRLMISACEKHKLLEIDPLGQKFDPNRHQAISMVPGDSTNPPTPPNHVASVLQKGYLISDRVLRPALVMVAQG